MKIAFTRKSENRKVGDIPVTTTARDSCPPSCFFYRKCYPEMGLHTKTHWDKVDRGERGVSIDELALKIAALPEGQRWRHNVAGDLPGVGERINGRELRKLVKSNQGRRGWTYTHKRPEVGRNAEYIQAANEDGFTINLSANNLQHADELAELDIAPVVTVLPAEQVTNTTTPGGRKVVVCPAAIRKGVTCASCGLCQVRSRSVIVGFPAHGSNKREISRIVSEHGGILYNALYWLACLLGALLVVAIPALMMFL